MKRAIVQRMFVFSFFLLSILAQAGLAFAKCPSAVREIYAPAVINENASQMIKISIEIRESNESGLLYSLDPVIGSETQKSLLIANSVARNMAEKNNVNTSGCEVVVKVSNKNNVNYIEGPSAGALFAVLMLSGLENKTIRQDTTVTGTIEPDGKIGPVGGLALKAEAAYKTGFKRIILPEMSNSEKIELLMLKRYYNITVSQAGEISEAYEMMTSQKNYPENLSLSPENIEEFNVTEIGHKYESWIKEVTRQIIADAEREMNETEEEYRENFQSRLANAKAAYGANHYYTSANIAFLLSIDKEVSLFSKERLVSEYAKTKECLQEFERMDGEIKKEITADNFQILGPAETRYMWAKTKLNETIGENEIFSIAVGSEFISPLLSKYKGVINAKYWCLAGTQMLKSYEALKGYEKGTPGFSEAKLKPYADEVLKNLSEIDPENEDALFRFESARRAYDEGRYVSALVDAAYIKSYSDLEEISSKISESKNKSADILLFLNPLLGKEYKYIWPIIFRNHASEISRIDKASALRIALIADNLETYLANAERIGAEKGETEIGQLVLGNETEENEGKARQAGAEELLGYQIVSLATVVAGALFIAFVILSIIGKKNPWAMKGPKRGGNRRKK